MYLELDREEGIRDIRQQGYADRMVDQDARENDKYLRSFADKHPALTEAEFKAEYIAGVVQREFEVKQSREEGEGRLSITAPQDRADELEKVSLDKDWFERASRQIREFPTVADYPVEEMAVAQAYWNGQRDLFNSAREAALKADPTLAKDLPAAIEVDEIRVRQKVQEQDQAMEVGR